MTDMATDRPSTENPADPTGGLASKLSRHVTLAFWVVKILATTLGETGGDALSMTLDLGYAVASLIYVVFFAVTLAIQVGSARYRPLAYWAVVVATTTVGTTLSDYLDRTVGLGYVKSSIALFCGVLVVLAVWRAVTGRIQFAHIVTRRDEIFYWLTILVSNTLGTALGGFRGEHDGDGIRARDAGVRGPAGGRRGGAPVVEEDPGRACCSGRRMC